MLSELPAQSASRHFITIKMLKCRVACNSASRNILKYRVSQTFRNNVEIQIAKLGNTIYVFVTKINRETELLEPGEAPRQGIFIGGKRVRTSEILE